MTIAAEDKASPEFTRLAPSRRRSSMTYVKLIEDDLAICHSQLSPTAVFEVGLQDLARLVAETPRKADYAWTTLARIISFAKDRGAIATEATQIAHLHRAQTRP
jgi:hypothetical protein